MNARERDSDVCDFPTRQSILKIGPFAAVSCSNDRTLRTWDHRVKGSVGVLRGHTGPVTCVQVSWLVNFRCCHLFLKCVLCVFCVSGCGCPVGTHQYVSWQPLFSVVFCVVRGDNRIVVFSFSSRSASSMNMFRRRHYLRTKRAVVLD